MQYFHFSVISPAIGISRCSPQTPFTNTIDLQTGLKHTSEVKTTSHTGDRKKHLRITRAHVVIVIIIIVLL
jgi:hypothetical protein